MTIQLWLAAHKVRRQFGKGDKKRDAGQKTPADIARTDNIVYGDDKKLRKWQLLDVYRPKAAEGKLPVIVSVHGGAWVYGDKDVYQFYCMKLAQRGFAVVNFSYRLAPEAKFPASLEDTERVFRWIGAHAAEYGFDTDNVFAVGDSAGAHLLALYASAQTNSSFAAQFPFMQEAQGSTAPAPRLRGIALNCGKYRMDTQLPGEEQIGLLLKALMPGGGTAAELEQINASGHVTEAFPPAYVMTCRGDFLREQAPFMTQALVAAGVRHVYRCYGTETQPLWHVFHCDPALPEAVACNDEECAFFRSLMSSGDGAAT